MTKQIRAVSDTNIFISAALSKNPSSPTREAIDRWKRGEFVLVTYDPHFDSLGGEYRGIKVVKAIPFHSKFYVK